MNEVTGSFPSSGPHTILAEDLIRLDKKHCWHPFTPMEEWCAPEHKPLLIDRAEGVWLFDQQGRRYIDGNSSIWTNIHGHNHPRINAAIRAQLDRFAHSSFLGLTHEPGARLAARLAQLWPEGTLSRVFFSDDGSTAMECALKMALQYWQQSGQQARNRFAAFDLAYHGDTSGTTSLGGIPLFHQRFGAMHFPVIRLRDLADLDRLDSDSRAQLAGVAIEPLIQGAAGMRVWPQGMLAELRAWTRQNGTLLILDEVMTGFGRTGAMFAAQKEGVIPDILALAKGLTAGYLPLAATMTSEEIFSAFLGPFEEGRTFYYGHSYTGSALGCAAALASLDLFRDERVLAQLPDKVGLMADLLGKLAEQNPFVAEIRQVGMIAAIDLVQSRDPHQPFAAARRTGVKVCLAARDYGMLTRPIGDTIVLMPPLAIEAHELIQAVAALAPAILRGCSETHP